MRNITWVLLITLAEVAGGESSGTWAQWREYGGSADASQYSSLTQINRTNVRQLQVAWTYPTGDSRRYFFSPLVVGETAYVLAKDNSIVALNAANGAELWSWRASEPIAILTNRGLNYWESPDGKERRLLFALNHTLRALDATTGKPAAGFGRNGVVDLKIGLRRDPATVTLVQSITPGRVFENLIILGSATNQGYGSAPGDIRAFDVRTGKLVWAFHTIPHPGEPGYESWQKDAWLNVGGANVWGEMSLDLPRGMLYAPTASAKYNFYGANRKGANLYANCLLALDARTGKRLWHFQMVHHDIWDYDHATAPKLLTLRRNGKKVDAVAQVTKQGFVFVFDRITGEPVFPIEERLVPKSDVAGEEAWPTQPFPVKPPPFSRQKFTVDDLSPHLSAEDRAKFRDDLLSARNEGLFTPPGKRNTVQMPGNNGGANWGGAAVEPEKGLLYVVSKDMPAMLRLDTSDPQKFPVFKTDEQRGYSVYRRECASCHGVDRQGKPPAVIGIADVGAQRTREELTAVIRQGQGQMPGFGGLPAEELNSLIAYLYNPHRAAPEAGTDDGDRYFSGFNFMIASDGLSPIRPPWSTLTAYDLNEGTIQWQRPLGTVPELAAKGVTDTGSHFPKLGPVVTAGGLIFAGTRDKKVQALDAATGETIWEASVGAAVEGIPAVYAVNGRQYVVFCAAAQAGLTPRTQEKFAGAYVAFALPGK